MAYAVIRTGGKQYRVSEGETLLIDKLEGNAGDEISFGEVLLVGGDKPKIGKPTVAGANVTGQIVNQTRGEKLVIFKFKRRKRYRRKAGHRQWLTSVKITSIKA